MSAKPNVSDGAWLMFRDGRFICTYPKDKTYCGARAVVEVSK